MSDSVEIAVLAKGCAWIMQHLLRQPDGVLSTRTGWMGGTAAVPAPRGDRRDCRLHVATLDPSTNSPIESAYTEDQGLLRRA